MAPKPADSTEFIPPPDVTGMVFVDRSGQRGRRLRGIAYAVIGLALVLLALLWLSQGADVFGFPGFG